jgi:hypothetical protein
MKNVIAKSVLALAAATATFSIPTTAQAGHRDGFRIDIRNNDDRHDARRVWVEPVYEVRCTKVWVEPVYRTESVPVFVKEYHETKLERVWVEPVYEYREVVRYERGRRICTRERVCVRHGGWQTVERQVCVPAHYRHETRQCLVTPGHYEDRHERVCVREGYWETVVADHGHHGRDRVSFNLGVFGRF